MEEVGLKRDHSYIPEDESYELKEKIYRKFMKGLLKEKI